LYAAAGYAETIRAAKDAMPNPPFQSAEVAASFAAFPAPARRGTLALRRLIFDTASATPGVGAVLETLKWGQPAYLTPQTRSGSTIRLGQPKGGGYALYVHCQTTILADFRALFPEGFDYEDNRAIHFKTATPLPKAPLRMLIASALTYHMRRTTG